MSALAETPRIAGATAVFPINDSCADALDLPDGTVQGDTSEATPDGGASCGDSEGAPDVWYVNTAPADGVAAFNTFGSELDTVISLHSRCPTNQNYHELTCNDDARGTLQSQVARQVHAGDVLLVRVSGFGGSTGSFVLESRSGGGAISGTVRDSNGAPRIGAVTSLWDAPGSWVDYRPVEADGSYLFVGLDPGDYFVLAGDSELVNEVWDDVPCVNCDAGQLGTPVPVDADLVDGIDFALEPGGSIAGTVVLESTGEPRVGAYALAYDAQGTIQDLEFNDYTGYSIEGLGEGTHYVRAVADGYASELYDGLQCSPDCDPTQGTPVEVVTGQKTGAIDFSLRDLGSISGRVFRRDSGAPIAGLSVDARDESGLHRGSGTTHPTGSYVIDHLERGDYFVRTYSTDYFDQLYDGSPCEPSCDVTTGAPVPVGLAQTTTGVNFSLDALGVIEGTVVGGVERVHLSECNVRLFDTLGYRVASTPCGFQDYRFKGLPVGVYFAATDLYSESDDLFQSELYEDLGCDPSCDVTRGTPLPVALNSTIQGIDFWLLECPFATRFDLIDYLISTSRSWEACETITAGPDFNIRDGGHVIFQAGKQVILNDGFSVTGGSLEIEVTPFEGTP
jgi:hypothetical protein